MARHRYFLGYLLAVPALLIAAGVGWFYAPGGPGQALLDSGRLQERRMLEEVALVDHDGEPFDQARLKGRWTLMFLGYTHCPDVCPMTLALLSQMKRRLAEQGRATGDLQVLFVSVDPARDPPKHLKAYVTHFDPGFIGVTGSPAALDALESQLGGYHRIDSPGPDGSYTVQHSAYIFVVDPQARLHARLEGPHRADAIAEQYSALRTAYDG